MQTTHLTRSRTHSRFPLSLSQIEIEGTVLDSVKDICHKATANSTRYGPKLRASPLRSGTGHDCPLSPFLINIILEELAIAIGQEKDVQGSQRGQEEVKHSLFVDNLIQQTDRAKERERERWRQPGKLLIQVS